MPTTPQQDQAYIDATKAWLSSFGVGEQGPPGPQGPAGPQGPPGTGTSAASWEYLTPQPGDNAAIINEIFTAQQPKNVQLQIGDFSCQSTITVPPLRMLTGSGDASRLMKAFNGDMIRLQSQSVLRDFRLFYADPAWVGGGIYQNVGDNFSLIFNVSGWAKEFFYKCYGATAGGRILARDCSWATIDDAYSVQLPTDSEVPGNGIRTFDNIVFNGRWGFDLGGAADTYIRRCNFTNFRFRDNTLGADVESCRFATGGPIEVRGSNHSLFNNRCQYPFHLMPSLNNSDIWQYRGAGVVNMGMGANVRIHA